MLSSWQQQSRPEKKRQKEETWLASTLKPENFIPGLIVGFLLGLFVDFPAKSARGKSLPNSCTQQKGVSQGGDDELKMVLVVRQDLKMGTGKIASQCAHAASGMYAELMKSQVSVLTRWEQCGQPKIVVTCKNQQEMNKLKDAAERIGLPTFIVADAGRTQVLAGSKTVLAIGPGKRASVDSITGKLRLL
ncbi:uncharacterized protein [Aristolochia californica]|uniref:uncharacterized protein isoform X2 n=1 Tax=Aristolochia californica TaxID=171875 RepID=UPI0035D93982